MFLLTNEDAEELGFRWLDRDDLAVAQAQLKKLVGVIDQEEGDWPDTTMYLTWQQLRKEAFGEAGL